jgi:hypothetical protein
MVQKKTRRHERNIFEEAHVLLLIAAGVGGGGGGGMGSGCAKPIKTTAKKCGHLPMYAFPHRP